LTLAAEQVKSEKALVWLFEVELLYRIETKTWTQAIAPNTACWYMDHAAEGKPSRVRQLLRSTHAIAAYTEKATLADCQAAASSWYYDAATGRLYVHTSGGDSPATAGKYYVSSHFWRRWVTDQFEAPNTIYDSDGRFIQPRLRVQVPSYSVEVNEFTEAGISESWSSLKIANPDGVYDAELAAYVWQMRRCYLKCGARGDAIASYTTVVRALTGSIGWTDDEIEIRTEDQLLAED
jgi:hypothetical protein